MFRKKNRREKHAIEDWMTVEEDSRNLTFRLSGELGYFAAPVLENTLQKFIASHKNTSLWIDLSAVSAIVDSRIISIFIQAHHKAQKRRVQLQLLGTNSDVRHVFKAVKVPETLFTD